MKVSCPYCHRDADLVTGCAIYPRRRDLADKWFYRCVPCDARVGCHVGTKPPKPLGRLANAELRGLKQQVHALFDPLWRSGTMSRNGAYAWLSKSLGISAANCHVGMFDEDQCRAALAILRARNEHKTATVSGNAEAVQGAAVDAVVSPASAAATSHDLPPWE